MAITGLANVDYDQTAWDLVSHKPLRQALHFDRFATVKSTRQSFEGTSVSFVLQNPMAVNVTPLSELVSATPTTLTTATVNVTMTEYGDLGQTSAKLRGGSFLPLDPVVAEEVGEAGGMSQDLLASNALAAGTQVIFVDSVDQANIAATDIMTPVAIRTAVANLKGDSVPTIGGSYVGIMHPDVEFDFQGTASGQGWRDPANYADPSKIYTGETGMWQGVRWITAARAPIVADAGAGAVDVYQTFIFGAGALAKAFSKTVSGPFPVVRPSPVTDPHWRFTGVGWYWLGGYKVFRETNVWRLESASSIGANV